MRLYIKNMVCSRCRMAVQAELEKAGLHPLTVELGEVEIGAQPSKEELHRLDLALRKLGFELIDDKKSRIIEKIKNSIIQLVHHSAGHTDVNLSDYIAGQLHYEYTYLSNLFSEVEGTTIEKYFISQRIEKVKELLVYDELSLSEIADQLGYSSVAYLSSQFKKVTGLTPTYYKSLKNHKRKNIEDL
jgi:AraC-like DNA-binding protein